MPIDWTRSFDRAGFDKNPYGKGMSPVDAGGSPVQPLPNIETYGQMLRSPNERPDPAGFLPMDVTFTQRRQLGFLRMLPFTGGVEDLRNESPNKPRAFHIHAESAGHRSRRSGMFNAERDFLGRE